MPKMKTRRAARKRMKVLPSGKVKRWKAGKSHILEHKSPKQRRRLRKRVVATPSDRRKAERLLPNG